MRSQHSGTFSVPVRLLFIGVAAVFLTLGLRALASILIPILFSLFATLIFAPLIHILQKRGIHPAVSVSLVILLFLLIMAGIGLIVVSAILQFNEMIPGYQSQFIDMTDSFTPYIASMESFSPGSVIRDIGLFLLASMAAIFMGAVNAVTTIGLIIITTAFLLIDAVGISRRVEREVEEHFVLAVKIRSLGLQVIDYVVIRTETNLVMGAGTAIVLLIAGVDFAILWGFLAFLLGYIPYIGIMIAIIPPAIIAFLQYGPLGALIIVVVILIINVLSDNVLFPSLAGRGLELSPSVVFLSLAYWGFVFGPAGAILSTPLTMVIRIILASSEETHWIGELLGETKKR
ncbi:AI-2E family transporter [Methanomethylovorans sp.]|uniref:AI-2E family transporter n=1 Tax=Methanomethylovorans sp. TaxID=2758717 RepID=UPI00351C5562